MTINFFPVPNFTTRRDSILIPQDEELIHTPFKQISFSLLMLKIHIQGDKRLRTYILLIHDAVNSRELHTANVCMIGMCVGAGRVEPE